MRSVGDIGTSVLGTRWGDSRFPLASIFEADMKTIESCSSIGTYQSCQKLYFYKYEKLLESRGYSSALTLGSFVHAEIERLSGKGRPDAIEQELKAQLERSVEEFHGQIKADYDTAKQIARLWSIHWEGTGSGFSSGHFEWQDAECEWKFPIGNISHVGKRDGLIHHKQWNKSFLYELKTATVTGAESYFNRLEMDRQISSNILALINTGIKVDGVLYDVIFKPAIRLLTGRKTKPDETNEEFAARFVEAMATDRPRYFQRQIIYRTKQQLEEHLSDLHHTLSQMEESRAKAAWPRSTGACENFGRLCPFFSMCLGAGAEAELMEGFSKRTKKLPELSEELNERL